MFCLLKRAILKAWDNSKFLVSFLVVQYAAHQIWQWWKG